VRAVERRKFERAPLNEALLLVDESGESLLGVAADVSLGGMFIEGISARRETRIVVYLHFAGNEWEVALPGIVRWTRRNGVGVQFRLLGAREIHALTEIIARAAPSHARQRAGSIPVIDVELDEIASR
jgi:PilZ domain-containing protein